MDIEAPTNDSDPQIFGVSSSWNEEGSCRSALIVDDEPVMSSTLPDTTQRRIEVYPLPQKQRADGRRCFCQVRGRQQPGFAQSTVARCRPKYAENEWSKTCASQDALPYLRGSPDWQMATRVT